MGRFKRIPITGWSEKKWVDFRSNGLGGSDIGALLGLSEYKSRLQLYLEKIGEPVFAFEGNKFTESGKQFEPIIIDNYQYFELGFDTMRMYENRKNGKVINKVKKYPFIVNNPKYPWLFGNIDSQDVTTPRFPGVVEAKNTRSHTRNKFNEGIDPCHIAQGQTYTVITSWNFMRLVYMTDGVDTDVFHFDPIKEVQDEIIQKSAKFWHTVLTARTIKEEAGLNMYYGISPDFFKGAQQEAAYRLMELEPDLTGQECESKFLRSYIKPTPEFTECELTAEMLIEAKNWVDYNREFNSFKEKKAAVESKLIKMLGGYHQAKDGKGEIISYKTGVDGRNRFNISKKLQATL